MSTCLSSLYNVYSFKCIEHINIEIMFCAYALRWMVKYLALHVSPLIELSWSFGVQLFEVRGGSWFY